MRRVGYPDGLFVVDRPADRARSHDDRSPSPDPVVVLVHGTLDRANSFRRVKRRLEDVRVVTYDRRGYQDSRGDSAPVGVDGHIDDLVGVLREIGERTVVVGHSLGGLVALGAAAAEPERIAAVGAFEPPIRWIPVEDLEGAWDWTPGDDPGAAVEAFFRRHVGDDAWNRLEPAARQNRMAEGPALLAELASLGDDALFELSGLSVPVVFGCGARSDDFRKSNVAWLVQHVPGAQGIEIPDAAHGAHLSHPNAFAEFVRAVIARGAAH